jgi:Arc/MetJ family transcription regulator
MSTNIEIDQDLLNEVLVLGGFKTKKAAVNEALAEYVRVRKNRNIIQLFGQIEYDPAYFYKSERELR